jgi:acyl carrier protein
MEITKEQIRKDIKEMLVERLLLKIKPEEISDTAPLFDIESMDLSDEAKKEFGYDGSETGLELDSVDALEIVVGIKKLYDIQIQQNESGKIFYSVNTLTDFVYDTLKKREENQPE